MRCISLPRLLLTSFLLTGVAISTASAAVQDRISAAVSSSRVTIPNSVHAKVRLATDLGPAAPDTRLDAMTLRFSMSAAQQAALDQLLLDQQNPSSPRYHQWLTPGQYAAQFGLSSGDIARVTAWLTSQGFTTIEIANSGTFVRFNGTVAQAQTAFATSIHTLSLNGETHFANVTDPAVPSAFAGVVMGITGLHDFRLKSRVRTHVVNDPVHTLFTSSITGNHYIAPGDFYTIYDVNPLLTAGTNGTGVTIGVMGQVDLSLADVASFRTAAGLGANLPTVQLYGADPGPPRCSQNCTPSEDDLSESSLDVEWSGAVAPSAKIIFVTSTDVFTSLTDAVDDPTFTASIISISYGECEPDAGANTMNLLNATFQAANARGITIVGPAGDDGASDCDDQDVSATQGLTVDFPASSPNVTGLGGTMFNEGTATGTTQYWNSNSSPTTANAGSALSYIPEAVWNEDTPGTEFAAGGGGVSVFFAKPTWQVGTGVPAGTFRVVPDIALNAAASHDGYLYCVSGSCTSGTFRDQNSNLNEAGGTSFAAPGFAGILALVEQKLNSRVGNANPTIYAMANGSSYSTIFHDVTTGNNNSLCAAGVAFAVPAPFTAVPLTCPSTGTIGYSAGVGYDEATGWGSVDANNLASSWAAITPPVTIPVSTADFTLTPSTTTVTAATATQNSTATFTVAPVNGFTGTISFAASAASTTGVTPTFSFSSPTLPGSGTTTLTISFPTASLRMPGNGISSAGPTLAARSQPHAPWYAAGSGAAMAFMLFFALPRKRRLGTLLAVALAVAMAAAATGCSSGNSTVSAGGGSSTPTSAVGSYTVVVTATSVGSASTTTHAVTVNLVVQ